MPKEECPRKLVLLVEVQAAMGALMSIHNEEVAALLIGDFDALTELKTKLQAARDLRQASLSCTGSTSSATVADPSRLNGCRTTLKDSML
jgi:hypothetical protein